MPNETKPEAAKPEPKKAPKEVIIVIDDPVTGRAHLEFPGEAAQPETEAPEAKKPEADKPQQPSNVQKFEPKKNPGAPKGPAQEEPRSKKNGMRSPKLESSTATSGPLPGNREPQPRPLPGAGTFPEAPTGDGSTGASAGPDGGS